MARTTASHQHPDLRQPAANGLSHGPLPEDDATDQWLRLHLRRLYGDIVDEPVPERLLSIVRRLSSPQTDEPDKPA